MFLYSIFKRNTKTQFKWPLKHSYCASMLFEGEGEKKKMDYAKVNMMESGFYQTDSSVFESSVSHTQSYIVFPLSVLHMIFMHMRSFFRALWYNHTTCPHLVIMGQYDMYLHNSLLHTCIFCQFYSHRVCETFTSFKKLMLLINNGTFYWSKVAEVKIISVLITNCSFPNFQFIK